MRKHKITLGEGIEASGGNETRYNCPFCYKRGKARDVKFHLYVHDCGTGTCLSCSKHGSKIGSYFCHRCGAKGVLDTGESRKVDLSSFGGVSDLLAGKAKPTSPVTLPEDYAAADPSFGGHQYLVSRGLTADDIAYYKIGVGLREYFGRVIVPSFDSEGEINFWVSRSCDDDDYLRYKNPEGPYRENAVFHLYRAVRHGWIVITEGVFSAIAVGRNAVATFGKEVSDQQVYMLVEAYNKYNLSGIVCCFDGDAKEENWGLAGKLAAYGCKVYVVDLPNGKDPDDVKDSISDYIDNAEPYSFGRMVSSRLGVDNE
jgi:hypothetical protein